VRDSIFKEPRRPSLRALAKQSMPQHKERMDCFVANAPRNDDQTQIRDLAASFRASFILNVPPPNQRAQGMPGVRCARSLACKIKQAHEHSHHGHTGRTRHSPRNGFNGFLRALPGDRACLPPSSAVSRKLDTSVGASGPHDFAVHKKAPSSVAPLASIASRPASVTIAIRPSVGRDGRGCIADLGSESMKPTATDWHDGQITRRRMQE
jgi:hypothetical protein